MNARSPLHATTPHPKSLLDSIRTRSSSLSGIRCSHVWPFQAFVETGTSGILMRQHIAANLYERLSTRPFLTAIEKVDVDHCVGKNGENSGK